MGRVTGQHAIRTDPATITGVGYVHAMQVDIGTPGGDFVAVGTAKGLGVDNCPNDYDPLWDVYRDGIVGGVYFCATAQADAFGIGSNPSFDILRVGPGTTCGPTSGGWQLTMAGVFRGCIQSTASSGHAVAAMLETTGGSTVDRDIDVKFTSMLSRQYGGTGWWALQGNVADVGIVTASSYSNVKVNDQAFNVYLAPLA